MDNPFLFTFVSVTIFSLMFTIGVNHSLEQLTSLWNQPRLLIRSVLTVVVFVPLVVAGVLAVSDLSPTATAGLALLAASPGAPLTSKRSEMAGGDPSYSASLQLILALSAIIVTPSILYIFWTVFEIESRRAGSFEVASQVAEVTFLPVVLGLILQKFRPQFVDRIKNPVRYVSHILFMILALLLIIITLISPEFRGLLSVGGRPTAAIVIIVTISLAVGHLCGGPVREQRTTLAIASVARNVGLALFIAQLCDQGYTYIPMILTYMILGAVLAVPYSIWNKRSISHSGHGSSILF